MAGKNGLQIALSMLGIPNAQEIVGEIDNLVNSGAIQKIVEFADAAQKLAEQGERIERKLDILLGYTADSATAELAEVPSHVNGTARRLGNGGATGSAIDDGCG